MMDICGRAVVEASAFAGVTGLIVGVLVGFGACLVSQLCGWLTITKERRQDVGRSESG
jgi:hypothetical protein